tara:strand:- start:135 stop:545 length:411 start_codon:yes stop_codon:yes gene_type:complete
MARLTNDYAFVWDDTGAVNPGEWEIYEKLVVISKQNRLQDFYTEYPALLPWAGPDDGAGYYIAYTSQVPRDTPVEGVQGNVGFLRASDLDPNINQSRQDFTDFVATRFEEPGITDGAAAHAYLINNGMWSTWELYN